MPFFSSCYNILRANFINAICWRCCFPFPFKPITIVNRYFEYIENIELGPWLVFDLYHKDHKIQRLPRQHHFNLLILLLWYETSHYINVSKHQSAWQAILQIYLQLADIIFLRGRTLPFTEWKKGGAKMTFQAIEVSLWNCISSLLTLPISFAFFGQKSKIGPKINIKKKNKKIQDWDARILSNWN